MKKNKIKDLEELRSLFKKNHYFPTDEILINAYLGINNLDSDTSLGQDIWALCLEGPAGAGKSSFVNVYRKILEYYFDEEIELIKYECNDTTGSSELVEEVGMVAVVLKNAEKIIIPGAITKAIQAVNTGKKVILFLDEFDKSRKETDVFFYGFLQSGEINTVQLGDKLIKDEYKGNLQVIFCKNDFRELSGPLSRRTRSLILDYMKPDLFYEVANEQFKNLKDTSIDNGIESLINLVTLIYEFAYQNKEKFDRLPSPSEMIIAIWDAFKLTTGLNINGNIIYSLIFKRLFKNVEDLRLFENLIKNCNNKEYKSLKDYLSSLMVDEEKFSLSKLKEIMASKIFSDFADEKTKELDEKIKEYEKKNASIDAELQSQKELLARERLELRGTTNSSLEGNSIDLNGGKLVLSDENDKILSNFDDSTEFIRRGESVFNTVSSANWTKIASITVQGNNHFNLISEFKNLIDDIKFKIYEDGILLNDNLISLVVNATVDRDGNTTYNFLSSIQVIPSIYLESIMVYMQFITLYGKYNVKTININSLIYNDTSLDLDVIMDDVYRAYFENSDINELKKYVGSLDLKCNDKTKVLDKYIEIIDGYSKKLVN